MVAHSRDLHFHVTRDPFIDGQLRSQKFVGPLSERESQWLVAHKTVLASGHVCEGMCRLGRERWWAGGGHSRCDKDQHVDCYSLCISVNCYLPKAEELMDSIWVICTIREYEGRTQRFLLRDVKDRPDGPGHCREFISLVHYFFATSCRSIFRAFYTNNVLLIRR